MRRTPLLAATVLICLALSPSLLAVGEAPVGIPGLPADAAPGSDVAPATAAALVGKPGVHLVDVRTEAEFAFVGHPVGAVNVPLLRFDPKTYGMAPNPRFLDEIRARFSPGDSLLVICRGGSRSSKAAKMLAEAGYRTSFNVLEGVEGDTDTDGHRTVNGWKVRGLPYEFAVDPAKVTPPAP